MRLNDDDLSTLADLPTRREQWVKEGLHRHFTEAAASLMRPLFICIRGSVEARRCRSFAGSTVSFTTPAYRNRIVHIEDGVV
jgi:hypothetical protein